MGCDIHFYVEKKDEEGNWQAQLTEKKNEYFDPKTYNEEAGHDENHERPTNLESDWYGGRNYRLFGMLADVRNGRGFAGVDTGDRVEPISDPRGLPADVSSTLEGEHRGWGGDAHSASYFTLAELLAVDWQQKITLRGWVSPEDYYRLWKFGNSPKTWAGGIDGRNIEHVSNQAMQDAISELEVVTSWTRREFVEKHPGVKLEYDSFESQWRATSDDPIAAALLVRQLYTLGEWHETWVDSIGSFPSTLLRMAREANGDLDSVRAVFWFDN